LSSLAYLSQSGKKDCDKNIRQIKRKYDLLDAEIHTAWILRKYLEQVKISKFDDLSYQDRRSKADEYRKRELFRLQKENKFKQYRQSKKNYEKTNSYIHLTFEERKQFICDIADCISNWSFARLFAECIDKVYFDPTRSLSTVGEQAFEQIVSRFEMCLQNFSSGDNPDCYGLVVHDNNPTVAHKHTLLMRKFHKTGTLWTSLTRIIETPLFVDSQLTSMVQLADLCAYALRRYLENRETDLFNLVFNRADRKDSVVVGVRHFSSSGCTCRICTTHKRS